MGVLTPFITSGGPPCMNGLKTFAMLSLWEYMARDDPFFPILTSDIRGASWSPPKEKQNLIQALQRA